ncbi:MAG: hypothetical protein HFG89_06120 [Dorea sp.]|jgi:hypothetical protein|nr:hypothetical protein [Dorea sp.]
MELRRRMRASMLIVILFCMMCVASVLDREERMAQADEERRQADRFISCEIQ